MRNCLLLAIVAALGGAAALAQLEKGTVAPDLDAKQWFNTDGEPLSLQDTRGMITVLYFWVSYHEGGKYFFDDLSTFENSEGQELGVRIIGLTSGDAKRTEPLLKKHKVFFPVGVGSKSDEEYRVQFWPYMVIVDPEGKVAWSGSPASFDEAATALREILANTPPSRTHPKAAREARLAYQAAREALAAARYGQALKSTRRALEKAMTGDTLKTHCQELMDLLEAIARDHVAQGARAANTDDWPEAVKQLRLVTRYFRDTDAYRVAKERLEALSKDHEEVRKLLGDLAGLEEARGDIKRARELIAAQRFGAAFELLEAVVEDFPDSAEADLSQSMLDRMKADARVMREVTDFKASKDCKEWIASARTYIAARKYETAKKLLRRVMDEYPDSKYAEEALQELAKLQ